mgnify:CR=1 FL=1
MQKIAKSVRFLFFFKRVPDKVCRTSKKELLRGDLTVRGLIWRWILNAGALYLTAFIIKGISIESFGAALVAALVWGFVNTIIRPILTFFTLPLTIMTLGLFTLVLNGFLLWLVADVVNGFTVSSFWSGILGAMVLSIASSIISALIED